MAKSGFKIKVGEISVKEEEWGDTGKEAYADKPEFQEGKVLWPEIHRILDKNQSLYLFAEWEKGCQSACPSEHTFLKHHS